MNSNRSLFFPMALIAAGVILLLVNIGIVPSANLWALTHVWPFFLIAAGLGLILRNYWAQAGILVSALIVMGVVLSILFAPQLGWDTANVWHIGWAWHGDFGGGMRGSGQLETETRDVSSFDSIAIEYPAEITIVQGTSNSLSIEAEDNLLPQLATEMRGDTLHIYNQERNWNRRVNPSEPVSILVTVAGLNAVDFSSAGTLALDGINTDRLEISLNGAGQIDFIQIEVGELHVSLDGAGDVRASGNVERLVLHIDGLAGFHAADLATFEADVEINGAGDAELNVTSLLSVEINGAGSITYSGNPEVRQEINGVGTVSKR